MTNQDIDGKAPTGTGGAAPGAPAGAPETLEQQLDKEREARALMRERLRTTEALAAESHALRARMAQELERVTADRDRLRSEAQAATGTTPPPAQAPAAAGRPGRGRPLEPSFAADPLPPRAAHASDRPLKPPVPARRKGPWGALAMLGLVAAAVAGVAWYKGSLPGPQAWRTAFAPAATHASPDPAATSPSSSRLPAPAAAPAPAPAAPAVVARAAPATGAVALPPVSPDAQLAATPPAAGPAPAAAPTAGGSSPGEMTARLRKALDGEGIGAPVEVDVATGRVQVTDPRADDALRQRTEMVIRAVYAGASLPEPQIEHRWLAPMHGDRVAGADAPAAPAPAATNATTAAADAGIDAGAVHRHAALERAPAHRGAGELSVADAEQLRPVLPAGRVTVACMDGLAGRVGGRRAGMTACMKHSCCSSAANHNSEECRAYARAYPFTCGAG